MMNPSTDLVTIAFSKLHSGSLGYEPGMATDTRLTRQESACRWMGIVSAVNRLPEAPRKWAYFAFVDEDSSRGRMAGKWTQAGGIIAAIFQELEWTDPKSWAEDEEKPAQKVAVVKHIVQAVYKNQPVINQDLAQIAGLKADKGFQPSRVWGQFRLAVNVVISGWEEEILKAIDDTVRRDAA